MATNGIWNPLDKEDLPKGAKVMTSTWACKKKCNGIYRGGLNASVFEQIVGKHFDTTIRIMLVLMLLADWMVRIYDVKGAFLKGNFEDGKEVFMEVPQGMEQNYWGLVVWRLLKPMYGLKQAVLLFW